ncbi:MAG: hypothetical protein Q9162_000993 [Coniocarpon cinnabarinum]
MHVKRETPEHTLEFKVSNFNILVAFLGGFLSLFGLVSYLLKEKFYLSEALISTSVGVAFSPHAANLIRPLEYARGNEIDLESITLYFTRLVLGVQLVLAGIQLPSRYLKTEWKSLSLLLGPGMCAMWMCTSLLVWAMVPNFSFLHALAVGSCVTPTDPVLSNSIVKGKFADKNIPKELQKIIIAESGANDGLGYPFLFFALYLTRFYGDSGLGQTGGAARAMGYWFGITWGYEILMSVLWGALVGYLFQKLLHWAEDRKYVDRESFLIFAISIALFIVGTVGMVGSDDVLACFIAGNVFTWDDWFRVETENDSFQPTIDLMLNVSIFAWYGAVLPWPEFRTNSVIPIYRLIPLGIMVLLFRRLPIVLLLHKKIHQIEEIRQAIFVGFFGPIGVSAIFYLYTSREYLREIEVNGEVREDAAQMLEVMNVVVWFMAVCSIVVHGLTIPLGKLGFYLPRTVSRALSSEQPSDDDDPAPFHVREHIVSEEHELESGLRKARNRSRGRSRDRKVSAPMMPLKIGGKIMKDMKETSRDRRQGKEDSDGGLETKSAEPSSSSDAEQTASPSNNEKPYDTPAARRVIKFPDQDGAQ